MIGEILMSPCDTCHGGCCRGFAVPLTGADIIAIERRNGVSFWEFVCRWADPTGKIARGIVPHFRFQDTGDVPFVICLLQSQSAFLSGTTKCRFLVEFPPDETHPLGDARCQIYGSRPSACRVFPTKLNSTSDLVVLCNVPASPREESHPAYNLCPREWKADEIDPIQSMQDLVVTKYEFAFFAEIARAWNQSPRSWEAFPQFLRLVYSRRVEHESAMSDESVNPIETVAELPAESPKPDAFRSAA
jgi:Fe-S-cluster containining protein